MGLRNLIPFHVIGESEKIGNRWGLIIRRCRYRKIITGALFLVSWTTSRIIGDDLWGYGRAQYFALVGWDKPEYEGDPHDFYARSGCQTREEDGDEQKRLNWIPF